jgi:phage terminase large subunit
VKLIFKPLPIFAEAYNTDIKIIKKERSFFSSEYDYFVDYGGRGSGKTKDKVKSFLLESTIRKVRVLVTRELQNSISESIKAEIETAINEMNLSHFFKITDKQIVAKNGSKFIFKGLKNNINSIKSIANVDMVLVEEAENVSEISWEKLLPSIRPVSGRAIVAVIFNPDNELDATWQTWIVNTPARTLLTNSNYPDNKYFPAFLEAQRKHDERVLPPKRYANKWLGIPAGSSGDVIIDKGWIEAARFASKSPDWISAGTKKVAYDPSGQGNDNNAVVYADGNRILEVDEWVKSDDLREATRRALSTLRKNNAAEFIYDECGGFGDGVSVFISDNVNGLDPNPDQEDPDAEKNLPAIDIQVIGFNAGDAILAPKEEKITGTEKQPHEIYLNQKAHAHGVTAQMLYNTYRFIELGERGINPLQMISIDIEDDELFKKITREMSTALWIKSENNSKKKVESKEAMKKRTGQESPNINDAIVMINAPIKRDSVGFFDLDWT